MNRLVSWLIDLFARIPHSVLALLGRLAIGLVFWNSGQTKLEGYQLCVPGLSCFKANPFSLGESTFVLFENEYALPLLPTRLRRGLPVWATRSSRVAHPGNRP